MTTIVNQFYNPLLNEMQELNKVENCIIEIDGRTMPAKYIRTKSSTVLYPGWKDEGDYTKTFITYIITFKEENNSKSRESEDRNDYTDSPCAKGGYIKMQTSQGGEYDKDSIVCDCAEIFRPYFQEPQVYAHKVKFAGQKIVFITTPLSPVV